MHLLDPKPFCLPPLPLTCKPPLSVLTKIFIRGQEKGKGRVQTASLFMCALSPHLGSLANICETVLLQQQTLCFLVNYVFIAEITE